MKTKKFNHGYIITKTKRALLKGEILNRKMLEDSGIHKKNASLHSFISTLRNEKYIPIESEATHDGTSNYYMLPEEIRRFHDPEERLIQIEEMKERKRQRALAKVFKG